MKKAIITLSAMIFALTSVFFSACNSGSDGSSYVSSEEEWQSIFSASNFNNFTVKVSSSIQSEQTSSGVIIKSSSLVRNGESGYSFVYDGSVTYESRYFSSEGALIGNYYNNCSVNQSSYQLINEDTAETYESDDSYNYIEYAILEEDNYKRAYKTETEGNEGVWSTTSANAPYSYNWYGANFCGIAYAGLQTNYEYMVLTTYASSYSPSAAVYLHPSDMYNDFELKDGVYVYSCGGNNDGVDEGMMFVTYTVQEETNTFSIKIKDGKLSSITYEYSYIAATDEAEYTETMITEYTFFDYNSTDVKIPDEVVSLDF